MLVLSNSIMGWKTGDLLSPNDLSKSYEWINNLIKDIGGQRLTHTPCTWQLVQSTQTPLTQADYSSDTERCRIRFASPAGSVIEVERIFCSAIYTASGFVDGYLFDENGNTPTGIINPIFTFEAQTAEDSVSTDELMSQAFTMTAGTDYIVQITPRNGATFSFNKCDITVDFKSDIFDFEALSTLDSVNFTFTEADPPDGYRVLALNAAVTACADAINSARTAYRPMLVQFNNFTSGSSSSILRSELPLSASTINCSLKSMYLWALWTGNATATVTALVANAAGTTQSTTTAAVSSAKFGSSAENTTVVSLVGTDGPIDPSEDYRVTVSVDSGTVFKCYALLWVT